MAILYDQSHEEPKLKDFYSSFKGIMVSNGYGVDVFRFGPIDDDDLQEYNVFLISFPTDEFSEDEISNIVTFVGDGGGLFLIGDEGDWKGFKEILNSVSGEFGITFNDDEVIDPTDSVAEEYSIIRTMKSHPIVENVDKFVIYGGCSLNLSSSAEAVATGDDDAYSDKEYYKAGDYPPVLAVSSYKNGRVACIGDGSLFRNKFINEFFNKQLVLNIVNWLSKGVKDDMDD